MNTTPRRRWFQFKFSTWFVLVALTAWMMALRPWGTYAARAGLPTRSDQTGVFHVSLSRDIPQERLGLDFPLTNSSDTNWLLDLRAFSKNPPRMHRAMFVVGPGGVVWPIVSLAAFGAWKLAWRFVERRKAARATT